jgi:hypothetical protein
MEKKSKKSDLGADVNSLVRYRNELAANDKAVFDKLLNYAKSHVAACAKSDRNLFESMLLAIVLEQQKKIEELASNTKNHSLEAPLRPQDSDLSMLQSVALKHPLPWAV